MDAVTVADAAPSYFGRPIDVSSSGRVVFPHVGLTKGDVIEYYARIAERMLRWIDGRPLAMKRWPDGVDGPAVFQKHAGEHFPAWLRREDVPRREGGWIDHVVVDEPATLVYLANQGVLEFHAWVATIDDLDRPDQVIIDLDPPAEADATVARAATRRVGELLTELGLDSWVKTSGSKGYHVHVPIERRWDLPDVRRFSADLAAVLAARHPGELTDRSRRSERRGRVFVDVLRNAYGQTAVAPYSIRGRPEAPVATPIGWDELGRADPRRYTVRNLFRRLGQRPDPWGDWRPQPLADARRHLTELAAG